MNQSAGHLPSDDAALTDKPAGDSDSKENLGPDPVSGAGIALFGIFLMGTGGALGAHYLFDVGVAVAMIGAVVFTLFVAISALKQRFAQPPEPQSAPPAA